ncbi:PREDICTED: protein SDE2 homolog [Priapulus caudatus]|uniref:Protein SDE2 homolog n=1 Tax=Priapulus caudatus TaxID=37621 RepID=A0ABM1EMY2_PRICU|nr:PREDICTED: protein SDE2 homolog [Priapulus caudatus]
MYLFYKNLCGKAKYLESESFSAVSLKSEICRSENITDQDHIYLTSNGKLIRDDTPITSGNVFVVWARLPGGKGGFGSMLRAIGAQIEKTTNREACRDLSGRRLRDINQEKRIKDWVGKQHERDREQQERRKQRLERLMQPPKHNFSDPDYEKNRSAISGDVDEALQQGMQSASTSGGAGAHKRGAEAVPTQRKKPKMWLGEDLELDSSEEEEEADGTSRDGRSPERVGGCEDGNAGGSTRMEESEGQESTDRVTADSHSSCSTSEVVLSAESVQKELDSQGDTSTSEDINEESRCGKDATLVEAESSQEAQQQASKPPHVDDEQPTSPETGLLAALSAVPPRQQTPPRSPAGLESEAGRDPVDLDSYDEATQLEMLGLDVLKEELMSRGMKCGGTLQQRAQRLFAARGLSDDQIDPSMRAKPSKGKRN